MSTIAIPSQGPHDWQRVLADPELHWKVGFSAMTLAACWEAAGGNFPPEVRRVLDSSASPDLISARPLLIIPEFKVPLPGGAHASQSDVFVLAKGDGGPVTLVVEGKVEEPFGPLVSEKLRDTSPGQTERTAFLQKKLGIAQLPEDVRYQLLHRTVSAILIAEQFGAATSVMLVHSFSPAKRWFEDFQRFAELLGASVQPDQVVLLPQIAGCRLYIGWCCGDERFLKVDLAVKR
jgi:hypothetical protein